MPPSEIEFTASERKLLNLLQEDIPLCGNPWEEIGRQTGFSADEVLDKLRCWQGQGLLRKIGPSVSPKALGWFSTLCAVKLHESRLPRFQQYIMTKDGITHCYVRENPQYNVWFTIIAPTPEAAALLLDEIRDHFRLPEIKSFPATETYKIKAVFGL